MRLTFSTRVREEHLLGRIMGPDRLGGYSYVVTVYELEDRTVCDLRPLLPDESHILRDPFGQMKVNF